MLSSGSLAHGRALWYSMMPFDKRRPSSMCYIDNIPAALPSRVLPCIHIAMALCRQPIRLTEAIGREERGVLSSRFGPRPARIVLYLATIQTALTPRIWRHLRGRLARAKKGGRCSARKSTGHGSRSTRFKRVNLTCRSPEWSRSCIKQVGRASGRATSLTQAGSGW